MLAVWIGVWYGGVGEVCCMTGVGEGMMICIVCEMYMSCGDVSGVWGVVV